MLLTVLIILVIIAVIVGVAWLIGTIEARDKKIKSLNEQLLNKDRHYRGQYNRLLSMVGNANSAGDAIATKAMVIEILKHNKPYELS